MGRPQGGVWIDTTIRGHATCGTGIVYNELYIGKPIWNRLRYVKNPDSGKRVSRVNPRSEWIVKDVPELRIIDHATWEAAKQRQTALAVEFAPGIHGVRAAAANRLHLANQPRFLPFRPAQVRCLRGKLYCYCQRALCLLQSLPSRHVRERAHHSSLRDRGTRSRRGSRASLSRRSGS